MKTSTLAPQPKKSKVKPVPEGMHTVTPHLVCGDAAKAIEFYEKAFGAVPGGRLDSPDGKVMHAVLRLGDSVIMLNEEMPDQGMRGPKALGGSSVTIHLYVENADASFQRAVKAGATVKVPLKDMFWGDRYGMVQDPFGHTWAIATHTRDLSDEEIASAAQTACD